MTGEEWLIFGIVYLILCTIVAWVADSRGHDPVTWFGIALIISPLLGFMAAVLVRRRI